MYFLLDLFGAKIKKILGFLVFVPSKNFFFKNICFFQKYFITFVNQYKQQLLWTH
jgi:hypothetical protein